MTTRTARASYRGLGKDGQGKISTQSGILSDTNYGFGSRFADGPGTNPEELIAAAHAGCFTMALSFALAGAGFVDGVLETTAAVTVETDGDGFRISKSALALVASIPNISPEQFQDIAHQAEKECPVSKLINADVSLDAQLR